MTKNLPKKFKKLWKLCVPLLKKGRPDDLGHAKGLVKFISNYQRKLKLNKDILISVAMMHDIGHSAILPEHFKYIIGPKKLINGKLVHMLAGAKIANDILSSVKYNQKKTKEIVDIISIHDSDQLNGVNIKRIYNSKNKKIFHDIDSLDWYNSKRFKKFLRLWQKDKLISLIERRLELFFYNEFKEMAQRKLLEIKKLIKERKL